MSYVRMTTGTIKNKDTGKREPFLSFGIYKNSNDFRNKMKELFEVDTYDHRTIKFADCIGFPYNSDGQTVLNLEYLAEDLGVV